MRASLAFALLSTLAAASPALHSRSEGSELEISPQCDSHCGDFRSMRDACLRGGAPGTGCMAYCFMRDSKTDCLRCEGDAQGTDLSAIVNEMGWCSTIPTTLPKGSHIPPIDAVITSTSPDAPTTTGAGDVTTSTGAPADGAVPTDGAGAGPTDGATADGAATTGAAATDGAAMTEGATTDGAVAADGSATADGAVATDGAATTTTASAVTTDKGATVPTSTLAGGSNPAPSGAVPPGTKNSNTPSGSNNMSSHLPSGTAGANQASTSSDKNSASRNTPIAVGTILAALACAALL